jgi:hypothetical protein
MSGGRFDPNELADSGLTDAELAELLGAARAVERVGRDDPSPSADFTDRVMAAVAAEPDPRPAVAAAAAVRRAEPGGVLVALRAAWRTAFGPGMRPLAVRAQAAALLLAVAVGITAVGGTVAVGAYRLLSRDDAPPPSPVVSPAPTAEPSSSPVPSASPEPSATPSPSTGPTSSPGPTDSPVPTKTAAPTDTPKATSSPGPTDTPRPTDTPDPDDTPDPTDTPDPDDTPDPTDSPDPDD